MLFSIAVVMSSRMVSRIDLVVLGFKLGGKHLSGVVTMVDYCLYIVLFAYLNPCQGSKVFSSCLLFSHM